jgi:hypothetical protein
MISSEQMWGAAAKLRQQEMRSRSELKANRDQGAVDFNADVAGKLKDESSRTRLDVRAAANPGSTIGNDAAKPGYDHRLVFRQERGQIENII